MRRSDADAFQRRGSRWPDRLRPRTDEGLSGGPAPSKRPQLSAALEAVRTREAAILVSAKLDRLSRSVRDAADLVKQSGREGWQLVTLDCAVDTSPSGRGRRVDECVLQLERRLISERTRSALAARKAARVQLGTPTQVPDAASSARSPMVAAFRRSPMASWRRHPDRLRPPDLASAAAACLGLPARPPAHPELYRASSDVHPV